MEKNILIIANNSGGLYQFRKELVEELIREGYQVYASIPRDDHYDDLINMGIKVIKTDIDRRGINPKKDMGLIIHYWKIMKNVKPDQIITYTIKPNVYGGLIARILDIPYAINITGLGTAFQTRGVLRKFVISCYKCACKKAKVVFFENKGNAELFAKLRIATNSQIHILNGSGVNLDKFYYAEYPENDEKTHFLFVGRIMREKGIEELLNAIYQLYEKNENVVLDILGYLEEDYYDKIQELSGKGIVNYYGHQLDVRPFIEKSHCFVLPSYHEGMANTNLECAAMGRPLITSRIHGCMEAVVEGKSGLLCEKQNVKDLYEKMKEFIELPYEEKKAMGMAGREHMEKRFDKKKVIEETVERLKK